MSQKNYFVRENKTEQQYFCQLQVSNKFRKSMDALEGELCEWIRDHVCHRTATAEDAESVTARIQVKVDYINSRREGFGPYLTMAYSPLRADENGFIRIERTAGRHQSLLLPIIDCRGGVEMS